MKTFSLPIKILFLFTLTLSSSRGFAQDNALRTKLQHIVDAHTATIGFSLLNLENGDTLTINGSKHLPMQSVYKFHLALAVLHQVDQRKLRLNQKVLLKKTDLKPDTWSPLREKYPNAGVAVPLSEILQVTVGQSDNNGCDILFRLLGGTEKVNAYIKSLGIKEVDIVGTEEEMHQDDKVQFRNYTTASEATHLLQLFYTKKILSKTSQAALWKWMTASLSGPNKLRAGLPAGTILTHKTGFSGVYPSGLTAATNDIGIVTLPNGKHFAIAVFVSMSEEPEATNDAIIAELAKVSWEAMLTSK
jgi:beta-lactamase class A